MAFCAGTVIGAAMFELLPEALETSNKYHDSKAITTFAALGFFIYMLLDKMSVLHSKPEHINTYKGRIGAGTFSVHSFFDGVAIGFGFQVSVTLGIIIAIAVIAHDFSDGINTVIVLLKEDVARKEILKWLIIDATTPFLGVLSTLFFKFPESIIGVILAVFAGCFLYLGASDLLPESQQRNNNKWTTLLIIAGAAMLYITTKVL
jgi:ZIP family zinc transporter